MKHYRSTDYLKHFKRPWVLTLLLAGFIMACLPFRVQAGNDVILEAMADEMKRSMESLQIENMEKPYYLEYTITDNREISIQAVFGSLTDSGESHNRSLRVDLRIGDYQLDNTAFVGGRSMFSSGSRGIGTIVTEDDYDAIRHDIWLETDGVYKTALEQLAAKKAFIKNQAQPEEIPDFSKEKSVKDIAPFMTLNVDRKKWETTVKKLSGIFRKFPSINDSGIELKVMMVNKYYVNSEGTVFRQPQPLAFIAAYASTQAEDGMKLRHHIPFCAPTIDQLPNEKELTAGIRKMAEELTALAKAPVLDDYIGPVLFTGQASAEMFNQVLVPHLSGERPPLTENAQMAQLYPSSKLASRLNRRVLPREISITDDPTITVFEKHPLIGSYKIDDQGVHAQPVKLVERGILKTLLMSRRPRKEIANSNGHARGTDRSTPGVEIGNLFITTEKGETYDRLKKELIQLCEDQGMPFGLVVKMVDNPLISGMDFSLSALFMSGSGSGPQLTAPVLAYKVYAEDGREELVRGLSFSEITVSNLKDMAAIGSDGYVHNRMLSADNGGTRSIFFSLFSGRGSRADGIPGTIVAPSVLFEELELKKQSSSQKNPPLLVHPFFR